MQDIIIFALVGISLISGVVLMFDVKWLRLPRLALPRHLPRLSGLLQALPFLHRGEPRDGEYEDAEFDEYQAYRAVDFGDDDAGSFAANRSPFSLPTPARRRSRRDADDEEDDGADLAFDYHADAYDEDEDAYEAAAAPDADSDDVEDEEEEEEEEDEEEESNDDPGDMMSFFEKAPEASKIPEALRNEVAKVSTAELLSDAREVAALLRRANRG